jgi:hypothetical protein
MYVAAGCRAARRAYSRVQDLELILLALPGLVTRWLTR